MTPTSQACGDDVRASTRQSFSHAPRRRAIALCGAMLLLACHAPDAPAPEAPLVPEVAQLDDPALDASIDLSDRPTPITVRTYDGSGQMVHPDAVVFPHAWRGRRYWFAATPYPLGDTDFENPSGYFGDSREDWRIAPGVTNPLARPEAGAYLSDPDLSYDPVRSELRLYYRQTTRDADQIFLKTSRDGVNWSGGTLVVQERKFGAISPTVVREQDGSWRMWTVGAGPAGCRASGSDIALAQRRSRDGFTWTAPDPVRLVIPGRVSWHWDIQYVRSKREYWALVAAYPDGSNCSQSAVFFARSGDGTTWTASPTPLLEPGEVDVLRDLVYRSSFRYFANDDVVMVWFSGARVIGRQMHFSLATARYPLAEFLRRAETPRSVTMSRMPPRAGAGDDSTRINAARAAFIDAFP